MATNNRGQPPACQQKVVHLPQVDKGTRNWVKVKKEHRLYEGRQSKPQGSCRLNVCRAQPMRREEFRLGTWNVTGVGNREVELKDALAMYKLDILGLSETWLKKGVEIEIPGYKWAGVEGESKTGRGGGIGFLARNSLWNQVG